MSCVVEMKQISFKAQENEVVRDFSFQFERGQATALVGPSGSGKSTALKLAAGLLVPSNGAVYFQMQDISLMNRAENLSFRKQTSMVFQDSALWANQNLYQILELPLKLHYPHMSRAEREQKMRESVAKVGYSRALTLRPSQLSMGEQKLIAFARAIVCEPSVMFLDEWTESLDESASLRLVGIVEERRMRGDTIIFVSHNFKVIKRLADYIVMIVEGKVKQIFTKEQISEDESLAHYIEKGIAL